MSKINAPSYVEEVKLCAVITRADGSTEDLGEVAYYHKNWLRRLTHHIKKRFV